MEREPQDTGWRGRIENALLVLLLVVLPLLSGIFLCASEVRAQDLPESLASSWEAQQEQAQATLQSAREEKQAAEQEAAESMNPDVYQQDIEDASDNVLRAQVLVDAADAGAAKERELAGNGDTEEVRNIKEEIAYYEAARSGYTEVSDEENAEAAAEKLEGSSGFSSEQGLYEQLEEAEAAASGGGDSGSSGSSGGGGEGEAAPPPDGGSEDSGGGINLTPLLLLAVLGGGAYFVYRKSRTENIPIFERLRDSLKGAVSPAMASAPASSTTSQRQTQARSGGDDEGPEPDGGGLLDDDPADDDDPLNEDDTDLHGDSGEVADNLGDTATKQAEAEEEDLFGDDEQQQDNRKPPTGSERRANPDADRDVGDQSGEGGYSGGNSGEQAEQPPQQPSYRMLRTHAKDMTAAAARGKYDEMVGRSDELEQAVEILARRKESNAALVGPAGSGKTSLVEGLAQRVAAGDVPASLQRTMIFEVDLAGMVAGAKYRGEFEERLKGLLSEVEHLKANTANLDNVILFVDEMHTIAGAGAAEGSVDAAQILKPALASGELQLVGATTEAEYRNSIEKDAALKRRFERVSISALTEEQTVEVLGRTKAAEERHHGVSVVDSALAASARLAARYVGEQALPSSATNLLASACSRAAMRGDAEVTEQTVAEVIARQTGVPVGSLTGSERERIQHLGESLKMKVIGQDTACEAVAAAVRRSYAGVRDPKRPVGSFLFLGPTGVGKSQTAKELARQVYGGEEYMVRIDMSEYQEQHSVSRLIGAPPGYVGHEEAGQLTEAVRQKPHSVVLLDEVEKAHEKVWDAFLQVLDDGRLTDGQGRTVDFSNAVIIMTSNLGSREIGQAAQGGQPLSAEALREMVIERGMRPELPPRMDALIAYEPLSIESVNQIARLELERVSADLQREHGASLKASEAAVGWVAQQGYDPAEGARPLRRVIAANVQDALADIVLSGGLQRGETVVLDTSGDGLILTREPSTAANETPEGQPPAQAEDEDLFGDNDEQEGGE